MPKQPILIIATRNRHKTDEFQQILGDKFEICDVTTFPELQEIEETGTTFLENARLKAIGISSRVGGWVLADDSGLEVRTLEGEPGVWSSSFGGEEGNHAKNNLRLLAEMEGKEDRHARFLCNLVLAYNGAEKAVFVGTVNGSIATEPSGSDGFGYDPLFIPEGFNESLAALGPEVKSKLSHRAKAVQAFVEAIASEKLNII